MITAAVATALGRRNAFLTSLGVALTLLLWLLFRVGGWTTTAPPPPLIKYLSFSLERQFVAYYC